MRLNETEIHARLAADFGGSLTFQPMEVTPGDAVRPVAMLGSVAQLLPTAAALRQALGRARAGDQQPRHPVFDILHHRSG
jgi:hypothetical protein